MKNERNRRERMNLHTNKTKKYFSKDFVYINDCFFVLPADWVVAGQPQNVKQKYV